MCEAPRLFTESRMRVPKDHLKHYIELVKLAHEQTKIEVNYDELIRSSIHNKFNSLFFRNIPLTISKGLQEINDDSLLSFKQSTNSTLLKEIEIYT